MSAEASILNTVKIGLGIPVDYEHFDGQLISDINSVFTILCQIGVGPTEEFAIADNTATWSDFMSDCPNLVQSYVTDKVHVMFDTSTISSYALEALNKRIAESEWRLYAQCDKS